MDSQFDVTEQLDSKFIFIVARICPIPPSISIAHVYSYFRKINGTITLADRPSTFLD